MKEKIKKHRKVKLNVEIRTLFDVKIPMRDKTKLSADIYLPKKEDSYPTILIRTPYNKALADETKHGTRDVEFFTRNGFVVVLQDVRGRGDSNGEWIPMFNEGLDGYDTVEWIAKQDWCNGKVAMMGGSYRGWVQWAAAREIPPHLTTMVSTAAAGYFMQELPFINGMITMGMIQWLHLVGGRSVQNPKSVNWEKVMWHLPLKSMDEVVGRMSTVWKKWISHPSLDDFWQKILLTTEDFRKINLPVLHITGWYDDDQPGAMYFYKGMVKYYSAKDKQFLISGPWEHGGTRIPKQHLGGLDFGPEAVINLLNLHLWWFEYYLKGDKESWKKFLEFFNYKKVYTFTMGENKWVTRNSWPPSESYTVPWYLHSNGKANTLLGDGKLSQEEPLEETVDCYAYDPRDPVVSTIDFNLYAPSAETPLDMRFIERRDDVLVFTSELLKDDLELAGTPRMLLYASSDCLDTDWIVLLSDVYPDGKSINLNKGGIRARYRNSLERPELLEKGKIYKYEFKLIFATSHIFKAGHRIRLLVTSSLFPEFNRNLNTGGPIDEEVDIKVAHNKVYHSRKYLSSLLLPMVQRKGDFK
ncbi:MAG TPA: CocE/NonD family hydrolase [Nitrospinota bacterium]|nr:CocE/NonD family hydrolase [Nitrospinota bacterium]